MAQWTHCWLFLQFLIVIFSMWLLSNFTWTLSHLWHNKKSVAVLDDAEQILPILICLLQHDPEVLADSCRSISYFIDGLNEWIKSHRIYCYLWANEQTQAVLQHMGALDCLFQPPNELQKEAMWTMSKITAGHQDQIQQVVNHELVPFLTGIFSKAAFKA